MGKHKHNVQKPIAAAVENSDQNVSKTQLNAETVRSTSPERIILRLGQSESSNFALH